MSDIMIEYIDSMLQNKIFNSYPYIPHKGDELWIEDECYLVSEVTPYFYSKNCKRDRIRVYLEKKEEE